MSQQSVVGICCFGLLDSTLPAPSVIWFGGADLTFHFMLQR